MAPRAPTSSGPTASSLLAALLLADGRFPSGAHAHSLGLEAAVGAGLVSDIDGLLAWLHGNLATTWRTDAAAGVHAARLTAAGDGVDRWQDLDAEVTARTTSPQLREVSRRLGRQLLRAVARTWPSPVLITVGETHPDGPHVAVVQGAAASVAGLAEADVAMVSLHGNVQLATSAAVRLLGLDPYAVTATVADLAPELAAVAEEVVAASSDEAAGLPAAGAPMLDLLLAAHATADGRLFAS